MAKRVRSDGKIFLTIGGVVLLAWLLSRKGNQNSAVIPDSIENRLDGMVKALNQRFGHTWVTYGLDVLQTYLQGAFLGPAALLNAIFWVERNYAHLTGTAKKQLALNALKG